MNHRIQGVNGEYGNHRIFALYTGTSWGNAGGGGSDAFKIVSRYPSVRPAGWYHHLSDSMSISFYLFITRQRFLFRWNLEVFVSDCFTVWRICHVVSWHSSRVCLQITSCSRPSARLALVNCPLQICHILSQSIVLSVHKLLGGTSKYMPSWGQCWAITFLFHDGGCERVI